MRYEREDGCRAWLTYAGLQPGAARELQHGFVPEGQPGLPRFGVVRYKSKVMSANKKQRQKTGQHDQPRQTAANAAAGTGCGAAGSTGSERDTRRALK